VRKHIYEFSTVESA